MISPLITTPTSPCHPQTRGWPLLSDGGDVIGEACYSMCSTVCGGESREEGIMVASVDRRGEAKCLQTHHPCMSPESPHVARAPAGHQTAPHVTTLQPIKRPAEHRFPLATGAWLNMHGHRLPKGSNQNCSHMLLPVGGCGADLIKMWT